MGTEYFDIEATFGDDYLWFYEEFLTEERSQLDTDEIISLLGLSEPASILDAPCGHGRISNRLASSGHQVSGVDLSSLFLDRARHDAQALGVEVDYRRGDLRSLPVDGPFDAVVCWFTSFGYFDDAGNIEVLQEFARVLRPGGVLLIEGLNHDGFVRNFTPAPAASVVEKGDDLLADVTSFNPIAGRLETERTVRRSGAVRRLNYSVRLPTVPELDAWLAAAGFDLRKYCGRSGEPLTHDTWRQVTLATKQA